MPYVRLHIDFDEFDDDELADHLRRGGYTVHAPRKPAGTFFDAATSIPNFKAYGDVDLNELGHIDTLAVCGQTEAAREIAIRIVSEAIGRPL